MLDCIRFVNSFFYSNSYILAHSDSSVVWIVDPGDVGPLCRWMEEHEKTDVKGILLTHGHFDHIYGINSLLKRYPDAVVYVANEYGVEVLNDGRLNYSHYWDHGDMVISTQATLKIFPTKLLLWNLVELTAFLTPGHSEDSVCFAVDRYLFTGDTLIKNVKTVTKLKNGSLEKLKNSIEQIRQYKNKKMLVCPGHDETFDLEDYDLDKTFTSIK